MQFLNTMWHITVVIPCTKKPVHYYTDKQNALRRECTFKIEIVLEKGVAGVNLYFI